MKEDKKNDWYDRFVALSAAIVLLMGIGGFGFGAIKSLSDSIKNRRSIHADSPKRAIPDSIPFRMARQQGIDKGK